MTAPLTTASRGPVTRLDHQLLRMTRAALGDSPAVPAARALSVFGEHALGWLAVGALGSVGRSHRADWRAATAGVVAAHGAGVVLKRVVRRVRPDLPDVPPLTTTASRLSFPSAHSCSTAAAAVGFAPMVGAPVMGAATAAMLVARVLLGVHYPSDVVSGAALGATVATVVRRRLVRPSPRKA